MTGIPDANDVESFIESVDDISRLIEGLKEGTISPEYIDGKMAKKNEKEEVKKQEACRDTSHGKRDKESDATPELTEKQKEEEEEKRAKLMEKALELKATYERKLKARAKFEEKYQNSKDQSTSYGTDYSRWDLWTPEDETDDLISQITPSNQAFRAMEKDIDDRHKKMIEQRQIAERQRVKGNEAYSAKQYSEALACYQEGLTYEKTNMTLHGNAAMAALKINCYVSAIEHCDKVLNIAELFHGPQTLSTPLCTKAYQRRATAFLAIQQHSRAITDLELALKNEPSSKEIQLQLEKAKLEFEEHKKQAQIKKAMSATSKDGKEAPYAVEGNTFDIEKLRQVEQLIQSLQGSSNASQQSPASSPSAPLLPPRPGDKAKAPTEDKVKTLKELTRLVKDDDAACIYLRECGGLDAAGRIVTMCASPFPPGSDKDAVIASLRTTDASLDLLEASCLNDGNLSSLPGLLVPSASPSHVQGPKSKEGPLLQAVAKLLQPLDEFLEASSLTDASAMKSHPAATVAMMLVNAAAVRLLCTASTKESIRPGISKSLAGLKAIGLKCLILHHLGKGNRADEVAQYSALALLGNCMVDAPVKESMRELMKDKSIGDSLGALIEITTSPAVSERALVIFGNMCGDAELRKALIQLPDVIPSAAKFAVGSSSKGKSQTDLQLAAITFLFNASIEAEAQSALLTLLSRTSSSASAAFWPGLMSHSDNRISSRASGALARCCKHVHPRLYSSDGNDILTLLVDLLRRSLNLLDQKDKAGDDEEVVSSIEGCIRALALLTQSQGGADASGHISEVVKLGVADLLVRSCQTLLGPEKEGGGTTKGKGGARDSALGNAALCISHLTSSEEALGALSKLDAVQPLVRVAYECTGRGADGETAVRNAGIALAKMAKRPEMLERLRELHGIEILARNVKKI